MFNAPWIYLGAPFLVKMDDMKQHTKGRSQIRVVVAELSHNASDTSVGQGYLTVMYEGSGGGQTYPGPTNRRSASFHCRPALDILTTAIDGIQFDTSKCQRIFINEKNR